jgi:pimeloyl-ACP methyl ester carboxylesterase
MECQQSRGTMTEDEKRAYHHVFDEPDSDHVVLTWPRTIPRREGDRGWSDMQMIQRRLSQLARVPTLLLWAPEDTTFTIQCANRLKELLPRAEGPVLFDRAGHFLQDDRGPDLAAAIIPFLKRTLDTKA